MEVWHIPASLSPKNETELRDFCLKNDIKYINRQVSPRYAFIVEGTEEQMKTLAQNLPWTENYYSKDKVAFDLVLKENSRTLDMKTNH